MGCFHSISFQEPLYFEYYGPVRQPEAANVINAAIADHIQRTNGSARIPIKHVTAPHIKINAALNKNPVSNVTDDTITISFAATSDGTITLKTDTITETHEFHPGRNLEQVFSKPPEIQWMITFDFPVESGITCRIITLNAHIAADPMIIDEKIVIDGKIHTISKVYQQDDDNPGDEGFNGGLCLICCSENSTVVAFPCRHCCMCKSCAERFSTISSRCPVCRAPVRELIYFRSDDDDEQENSEDFT